MSVSEDPRVTEQVEAERHPRYTECSGCGQPGEFFDSRGDTWWSHFKHPADEHDFDPMGWQASRSVDSTLREKLLDEVFTNLADQGWDVSMADDPVKGLSILVQVIDEKEMVTEYRAVFSYSPSILGASRDTYGPERKSQEATKSDYCYRPEETHGWRSGTQTRQVSDWEYHPKEPEPVDTP